MNSFFKSMPLNEYIDEHRPNIIHSFILTLLTGVKSTECVCEFYKGGSLKIINSKSTKEIQLNFSRVEIFRKRIDPCVVDSMYSTVKISHDIEINKIEEIVIIPKDAIQHNEIVQVLRRFCVFTQFHQNYSLQRRIAKGGFSEVFLVYRKTDNKKYAAKMYRKSLSLGSSRRDMIENEICILRWINHPNIILLEEIYETEQFIILITEYIQGVPIVNESLSNMYSQKERLSILSQLIDALLALKLGSIVHRDIKPSNILIENNGTLKIIDFNLAIHIGKHTGAADRIILTKLVGTPGYIAPELLARSSFSSAELYKSDIFSFGIIYFMLAFNKHPFAKDSEDITLEMNRLCELKLDSFFEAKMLAFTERNVLIGSLVTQPNLRADINALRNIISLSIPSMSNKIEKQMEIDEGQKTAFLSMRHLTCPVMRNPFNVK